MKKKYGIAQHFSIWVDIEEHVFLRAHVWAFNVNTLLIVLSIGIQYPTHGALHNNFKKSLHVNKKMQKSRESPNVSL